ncbi:MAG: hypothetical protein E7171_00330 [Firmicutes bacterium]|nr:hypothetical protein [Bacillota bacterium]
MKLRQIVCDGTDLTLIKEKKVIKYGETFEVSELRGREILNAKFKEQPVAEVVVEEPKKTTTKKAANKEVKDNKETNTTQETKETK